MRVSCENISKSYNGKTFALKGVTVGFGPGIYALLGENGAGKSTLMNILTGILKPTTGIVSFHGTNIQQNKKEYCRSMGYLPQKSDFYPYFSGAEFMEYMGMLKKIPKGERRKQTEKLLKQVNLWENAGKKSGAYSGGMRKRLGIAQAMLGNPEILLLDEPTAGLDPEERARFRELIHGYASQGHTVIVSTHILDDIEGIADQILLIHQGKLVCSQSPEQMLTSLKGKIWMISQNTPAGISVGFCSGHGEAMLRVYSETMPVENALSLEPVLEDAYHVYCHEKANGQGDSK